MHDRFAERERHVEMLLAVLRAARHPDRVPLVVSAFHVPGEPVPVQEATAATFEPFDAGGSWGAPWSTTWFRFSGTIPSAWAGKEVVAVIDLGWGASALVEPEGLVWDHAGPVRPGPARPVQGLSRHHDEVLVRAAAVAGDQIELLVEAAANAVELPYWDARPEGWDGPAVSVLRQANLAVVDRTVESFVLDATVALELLQSLPPSSPRRHELLVGLERACAAVALDDPAGTVAQAAKILAGAYDRPAAASAPHVLAAGHAHIDSAWLWPVRETIRKCARTFASAVRYMDRYPGYRFVASSAQHYAWMKEHYPDLYRRIAEKVADGQFEPVGGMWVEADCNLPSGESLVRQLVQGRRFFRDEFGVEPADVWLPDDFGFPASMPQIFREAGASSFVTQKLSWNEVNRFPHHSFLWEGLDGSRIATHFPPADTYNSNMTPQELAFGTDRYLEKGRSNRWLYLYGYGDGGGGPTPDMLERAQRLADVDGAPKVRLASARSALGEIFDELTEPPVWVGELYLEMHRGTYTSQARTKRGNRTSERLLHEVELWASMAHRRTGAEYPNAALDECWRTVLLHQFHDILPGSSIGRVHREAEEAYAVVAARLEALAADAFHRIARSADTSWAQNPIVLGNAAPHGRSEIVLLDIEIPDGDLVTVDVDGVQRPTQRLVDGRLALWADIPANGYTVVDLRQPDVSVPTGEARPVVAEPEVEIDHKHIRNGPLRLAWDSAGLLTSVSDLAAGGRELLPEGAAGNRLMCFDDRPRQFDAWDIDLAYRDRVTELGGPAEVEVVDRGPLVATVRTRRHFGRSSLEQLMVVRAGSRRIDFETVVDWHEDHTLLKVAFPLDVHSHQATYEIQFGAVERPTHTNTSWDAARFEVCAHRWADLSEPGYGAAVLNDCKYGYDVDGGALRLSLLRSPTSPDPKCDRGEHRFTYSLLPHLGDHRRGGVVVEGFRLNRPVRAVKVAAASGSFPSRASFATTDAINVIVDTVKRGDDGDGVVVRLYEAHGERTRACLAVDFPIGRVQRTDLLERPQDGLDDLDLHVDPNGSSVSLMVRPYQLLTLKLTPAGR